MRDHRDKFNVHNYKKSFSISVLERSAKQQPLAYHRPEYDNANPSISPHNSQERSSLLLDKFDSSDDYGRIGGPLVKNTESDDEVVSSTGSMSRCSMRQMIKNQPNHGALKHLAVP